MYCANELTDMSLNSGDDVWRTNSEFLKQRWQLYDKCKDTIPEHCEELLKTWIQVNVKDSLNINNVAYHDDGRRAMVSKFWCQEIGRRWRHAVRQQPSHARLLTEPTFRPYVTNCYLFYRWTIFLLWASFIVCSMFEFGSYKPLEQSEKWLIYLTNWDMLLGFAQALVGGILVSRRWRSQKAADFDACGMTFGFTERLYWFLYVVTTNMAIGVTVCYWLAVYNPAIHQLDPLNIMMHVCNSVLMLVDLLVTSVPFHLQSFWWCLLVVVFYLIFSMLYYLAGGLDKHGYHYIYEVLDWKRPTQTLLVCVGGLTFVTLLHCIMCMLVDVRNRVYRRITERSNDKSSAQINTNDQSQPEQRTETV